MNLTFRARVPTANIIASSGFAAAVHGGTLLSLFRSSRRRRDMYKTHTKTHGESRVGDRHSFPVARAGLQLARHVRTHYYLLFDKWNTLANGSSAAGAEETHMGTCKTTRVLAGG